MTKDIMFLTLCLLFISLGSRAYSFNLPDFDTTEDFGKELELDHEEQISTRKRLLGMLEIDEDASFDDEPSTVPSYMQALYWAYGQAESELSETGFEETYVVSRGKQLVTAHKSSSYSMSDKSLSLKFMVQRNSWQFFKAEVIFRRLIESVLDSPDLRPLACVENKCSYIEVVNREIPSPQLSWDAYDVDGLVEPSNGEVEITFYFEKSVPFGLYDLEEDDGPLLVFYSSRNMELAFNIIGAASNRWGQPGRRYRRSSGLSLSANNNRQGPEQERPFVDRDTAERDSAERDTAERDTAERDPNEEVCTLHPWYISFESVGLGPWIIQPTNFKANICLGTCLEPLPDEVNATNHAYIKSLYRSKHVNDRDLSHVPPPCCGPVGFSSLTVLYQFNGTIVMSPLVEMTATRCGCL